MFTFNGITKIIQGDYGSGSTVELDIRRDLYSAWKEWTAIDNNAKYLQAFSTTGGDPISLTIAVGAYFFLENGWKIRPFESNHRLVLNGNLYTRDDSSPFLNVSGYSVITETRNSSLTQTVNTGGGGGGDTKQDIYNYFTSSNRQDTFRADISNLPTKTDLEVVNEGVKKASILVPHNEDL